MRRLKAHKYQHLLHGAFHGAGCVCMRPEVQDVCARIGHDISRRTLLGGLAALIGAVILLFSGILPFADAMNAIDFNTLAVLTGMMMFVGVIKESGLFEYLAIKSAKIAKGGYLVVYCAGEPSPTASPARCIQTSKSPPKATSCT